MSSPGAKLSVINISGTKIQSNKTMTIEEFATTETKKEIFTKAEPKKADCTKPESTKEESAKWYVYSNWFLEIDQRQHFVTMKRRCKALL